MNVYPPSSISPPEQHSFAFLQVAVRDHMLYLTLDRAKKKNALHPQMVNELAYALQFAHQTGSIWGVVLQANGNVFCAGADLKAFMGMADPHDSTIPLPQGEILLGQLFQQVHKPILAKVAGDVFAGGFLLLTGCHLVVTTPGIRLGLPEVRRGIFPFQVMAALMEVMPKRKVLDWCIRGYDLPLEEAVQFGLVSEVCGTDQLDQRVEEVLADWKSGSPTAIRMGLKAFDHLHPGQDTHRYLMEMLQKTLMSQDGQEGLRAFREKRPPNWKGE